MFRQKVTDLLVFFLYLQDWTCHVSATKRTTLDDYLNTCIDSIKHKTKPGPEAKLFQQVKKNFTLKTFKLFLFLINHSQQS